MINALQIAAKSSRGLLDVAEMNIKNTNHERDALLRDLQSKEVCSFLFWNDIFFRNSLESIKKRLSTRKSQRMQSKRT